MCLNPKKIRVKSNYISSNNYKGLFIQVPCGTCAECMELKRDQWYLRNYWHSKECFDKGGYVFFETLSYRDSDLPHLSDWFEELKGTSDDYSCFNYEHYRNFMKRLRINLTRGVFEEEYIQKKRLINLRKRCKKGSKLYADLTSQIEELDANITRYSAARNLNAFCVCEYGSEDYYQDDNGRMRKATFRPHYHLLFYVNVPGLDSCTLAKYIYKSWTHGKTDSYDSRGVLRDSYVRKHNTIGANCERNTDLDLRKVSKYVAKYITKDSNYSDKLRQRVASVTSLLFQRSIDNLQEMIDEFKRTGISQKDYGLYGMYDKETQTRIYRDICRRIDGFHLQGQGFGLYALDPKNFDEAELFEKGTFSMPDSQLIVKHIPAPMYYIRHLYYDMVTPRENPYISSPSYILKTDGYGYKRNVLQRSYDNYVKRYCDYYLNMDSSDKDKVDSYLDGRTLSDFVAYKLFYQNRLMPFTGIDFDYRNVIEKIVCDKPLLNRGVYIDEGDCWIKDPLKVVWDMVYEGDDDEYAGWSYFNFDDFTRMFMITQKSDVRFRNFDRLDDFFVGHVHKINEDKQKVFDENERLQKKYKKMRQDGIF